MNKHLLLSIVSIETNLRFSFQYYTVAEHVTNTYLSKQVERTHALYIYVASIGIWFR